MLKTQEVGKNRTEICTNTLREKWLKPIFAVYSNSENRSIHFYFVIQLQQPPRMAEKRRAHTHTHTLYSRSGKERLKRKIRININFKRDFP